jgi:hypothetical protein
MGIYDRKRGERKNIKRKMCIKKENKEKNMENVEKKNIFR